MKKIPIKIIELTTPNGQKIKEIKIDILDYFSVDGEIPEKIKKFKKEYFELVEKVRKIFYGKNEINEKKYQNLSSITYYKIGKILQKFNGKEIIFFYLDRKDLE